ncbi:MAG: alcohol dehydrogenase catalytic domain-containing protein, partial [Pseudomonadota bacterium]
MMSVGRKGASLEKGCEPAMAVVLEAPRRLGLRPLSLAEMGPADVAVAVDWTGVSTGTERLLWSGEMPPFPGMGYPLVPGYESVGRVVAAGPEAGIAVGETVFTPGARCFSEARCLFGGAASRLVTAAERVHPVPEGLGAEGALMALAAT